MKTDGGLTGRKQEGKQESCQQFVCPLLQIVTITPFMLLLFLKKGKEICDADRQQVSERFSRLMRVSEDDRGGRADHRSGWLYFLKMHRFLQ